MPLQFAIKYRKLEFDRSKHELPLIQAVEAKIALHIQLSMTCKSWKQCGRVHELRGMLSLSRGLG